MNKGDKSDWLNSYLNIAIVVDIDPGHILIGDLIEYSSEHIAINNKTRHP